MQQQIIDKVIDVSEYEINFSLYNLSRFFLYHFLYFFCLPLCWLLVLSTQTKSLLKNMYFWPRNHFNFKIQSLAFFLNAALVYIVFVEKPKNVYRIEWASVCLYTVFRCIIVAVRYSFASPFRIKMLTKKTMGIDFIGEDLFVNGWHLPFPRSIDMEIDSFLWRSQVEETELYFYTGEHVHRFLKPKLTDQNFWKSKEFDLKMYKKELNAEMDQIRKNLDVV